jgi:hypothetical protein
MTPPDGLTPHQQRLWLERPAMRERLAKHARPGTVFTRTVPPRPPRPRYDLCPHRGKVLDRTACGCNVYGCALHGTCSTSRRAGVKLCQHCDDFHTS